MNSISGVYWIRNKINNHIYIGSSNNIRIRFNNHKSDLRNGIHNNPYLQNAWNKYGEENFEFKKIISCHPNLTLFYEQQFLDQWNPEYNICEIAGKPNPIKYTDKMRAAVSKFHKGKKRPEETRARMRKTRLGYHPTKETKEKQRQIRLGTIHSDNTKKKMSVSRRKYLYTFISPNQKIFFTNCVSDFAIKHNLTSGSLYKVINKKLTNHKGWKGERIL